MRDRSLVLVLIGCGVVSTLSAVLGSTRAFAASDLAFTVGNYPVEATAADAVTAKDKALAEGQQAAFKSLLKRLVPVTAYKSIAKLKSIKAADLVSGVSVKSERNSSTQYIANLDFAFQPAGVRDLLRREGVPFVETQAPVLTIVPVAQESKATEQVRAQTAWTNAWKGLDGKHALTPFKVEAPRADLKPATIKALTEGNGAALSEVARSYGSDLILVAVAEMQGSKLAITLAGQDAVGPFVLARAYKVPQGDVDYTRELAAVIAVGTLEGRWKAVRVRATPGGIETLSGPPAPVQLFVEYRGLQQWQDVRRRIADTPGVEDLQIGGVSARGADIALRFPGGGEALSASLADQGLQMRANGGTWVVTPRY